MKRTLQAMLAACSLAAAAHAAAQVTFYEGEGFRGRAFTIDERVWNFDRSGFNDRAASAIVEHGRWELCEHARFEGRCVVLRRGSYPSLREVGVFRVISWARPVEPGRFGREAPPPQGIAIPREEPPRLRPFYGAAQPPVLPVPE